MDKIILYKNDDGEIMQATDFEPIDRDELVEQLEEARANVRELQSALNRYDRLDVLPSDENTTRPMLQGDDDGDGHVKFNHVNI